MYLQYVQLTQEIWMFVVDEGDNNPNFMLGLLCHVFFVCFVINSGKMNEWVHKATVVVLGQNVLKVGQFVSNKF